MRQFAPSIIVFVSAVVAVAAYLQALHFPFVADDIGYITQNTKLAGLHLSELWRLFTEPYNTASEFLPLRELSYWLDMSLFGKDPAAFRLHNIILHLICLPLVYVVTLAVWRYFRPTEIGSAPWVAAAVTALFALHPALVESVVYISGRKYMLPNLFSMLALWFAFSAKREHGLSTPHAAAALFAFVAVMLSKASYVPVAPVIALLWVMFWRDIPAPGRRRMQLLWPLAILFLAGILIRIFIVSSAGAEHAYFGIEVVTRTLALLGWQFRLAITPESHHFYYPVFEDPYFPAMVALGGAVLAAVAVSVVMLLRKRQSLEGFALIAFLLLSMPYLQLIPYVPPSLAQDRFVSLAAWPILMLIVALSGRLKSLPRAALLLLIILLWGLQTVERTRDWRSFEALLDADLRAYPGYYIPAMYKIIFVQLHHGLHREASETANSITDPEFRDVMLGGVKVDYAVHAAISSGEPREAMTLLWEWVGVHKQPPAESKWNLPITFFWNERRDLLKNEWKFLTKRFPDDVSVRYNAGLWLLSEHYEAAETNLRAAVESQRLPESMRGTAFKNLGLALLYNGRTAEAEAPLRAALEQSPPDFRAYCLLSGVYKASGRNEEAARTKNECRSRVSNEETAQ